MIDILNAKKEFKKYVSSYNPEHPRVRLKISHIERVAQNSKMIAEYLNLPEEDVKLAELIGFFHDFGRFEQVRIADTFSDKDSGINHAQMSNKVLFEDGIIRNFLKETTYDDLIKKAIYNHNRAYIDSSLNEREMLFAKIIRDADKLDIFYVTTFSEFLPLFWYKTFDQEEISEVIMKEVDKRGLINYNLIKNNADQIPMFYAYIFDLYFDITIKKIADAKYLEDYTERVKENFKSKKIHEQADYILGICNDYIDERLKEYIKK